MQQIKYNDIAAMMRFLIKSIKPCALISHIENTNQKKYKVRLIEQSNDTYNACGQIGH